MGEQALLGALGASLRVRLYADKLEIEYQGQHIGRHPQLCGRGAYHIDYRHLIHSLARLRRGPQDVRRDIQVSLAPYRSRGD